MKKLAALLLAMCMMIAAIPALADSAAGNWYMVMADVTLGYVTLNEDGSAVANLLGTEEEMTGTWTAEENAVTLTIEDDPLTFAFDGTSLFADQLGIPLTREEGKLPMALMAKVINGEAYELPEGMTEEDMTTFAMNFLAEYQKLLGEEEAPDEEAAPAEAEAAVAP